jgi:hypothetical protein
MTAAEESPHIISRRWYIVAGIIFLIIALLLTHPVSALAVTNVQITPNTSVMVGQPVSASFTLDLTPWQFYTMNTDNYLALGTGLDSSQWTQTLTLDEAKGQAFPTSGKYLNIPGWTLAYPLGTREILNITLWGLAPNVSMSQNLDIFRVQEYTKANQLVPGSEQDFPVLVINGADISYITAQENQKLAKLNGDIQSTNTLPPGTVVDRTAATALYQMAKNGITYLQSLKPEEYPQAVGRAQEVDQEITEAENTINRESVQAQIDYAIPPINRTAMILAWFAGNESTANYTGLSNISAGYQEATNDLDYAAMAMNEGNWQQGSTSAAQAFTVGNQTWFNAVELQKRAEDPLSPIKENWWPWVPLAAVICLGVWMFKPKKKKPKKPVPQQTEKGEGAPALGVRKE